MRTYHDFTIGEVIDLSTCEVTRDEVIAFASEFDPQPFHLDDDAGAASMLGGLAASGWHTCAMLMRLLVDELLKESTCQGSPGIDSLRWLHPVYPGDRLSASGEVLDKHILNKRPDIGLVTFRFTVRNQSDRPVAEMVNPILFGKEARQ